MIETNDSVTELERIKAKRATIFNLKSLCEAVGGTYKSTQSTGEDEFEVNLEENGLFEWRKSRGIVQRIPGSKLRSYLDRK
jgi:hypothetical protein